MNGEEVVILAGGVRSIGRIFALRFAAAGYRGVVADTNASGAEAVVAEITAGGGVATAVSTDVSKLESCRHMAEQSANRCGRSTRPIGPGSSL